MKITREWAMPNPDTFSIPPIAAFIERWCRQPSVDPFARNTMLATYRNDLSPATKAEYHMDAVEFCAMLRERGTRLRMALFDPPYSPRQITEVYQSVGRQVTTQDTQSARLKRLVRLRGYEIEEILLVSHGGDHNDTICVAERKL